jgi:hypothetical protein
MKYIHPEIYRHIKYIRKNDFAILEAPDETKKIINELVYDICGEDDTDHACLLRAFYLRDFGDAAGNVVDRSSSDEPFVFDEIEEREQIIDAFNEWRKQESSCGIDLEYMGCIFLDGVIAAERLKK